MFFQKSSHLYYEGLLVLNVGGCSGGEGMEIVEIGKDPPLHPLHWPLIHYHRHQLTSSVTNNKNKKKRRDLKLHLFFFFFAKIWGFISHRIEVGALFLFFCQNPLGLGLFQF